ncbi:MAG: NAD-dependent epimerase/dehydratase family protein [Rhodospirillaceae bacterium]|nr:NAD-dependent epimerase/dehydratase family protein [Rhodospirillaceae bacterium]
MGAVLVTGATGFVGAAVARRLLSEGAQLRFLVRAGSDTRNIDGLPGERAVGDLGDPASLARAVAGCEAVFHVAADYRLWVPRPAEIYRANVDGSAALVRAAAKAGVGRIVYCSSVAVLGTDKSGRPADEDTPVALADMIGHYKRSKFLAEEAVRDLAAKGAPVVIVNPSTPVGPRDIKPTPTGRLIRDAALGKMPAYVDTGLNIVHVDDVAEGHLLAYAKGRIGERYVLGGDDMSLRDILAVIAAAAGRKPPSVRLPRRALYPLAYLVEGWARLVSKREPLFTVDGLRMAAKRMYFSSAKARRELGYAPRPGAEALRDAVAWIKAEG